MSEETPKAAPTNGDTQMQETETRTSETSTPPAAATTTPEIPDIMRSDTDEFISSYKEKLAQELAAEIVVRKEELAQELEVERQRKLEERRLLAFRLENGIESDEEDEDDEVDESMAWLDRAQVNDLDAVARESRTANMIQSAIQLSDDEEEDLKVHGRRYGRETSMGSANLESLSLSSFHTSISTQLSNEFNAAAAGDSKARGRHDDNDDKDVDDLVSEGDDDDDDDDDDDINDEDDDLLSIGDDEETQSETTTDANDAVDGAQKDVDNETDVDNTVGNAGTPVGAHHAGVEDDVGNDAALDVSTDINLVESKSSEEDIADVDGGTTDFEDAQEEEQDDTDANVDEEDNENTQEDDQNDTDANVAEEDGLQSTVDDSDGSNETLFYRHLKSGFDYLRKGMRQPSPRKKKTANSAMPTTADLEGWSPSFVESLAQMPLVNFIDPSSSTISSSAPLNSPSKRRAWNRERPKPKLSNLYIFEKFDAVFQKQFDSTLRSISYRNLHTNGIDNIEYLPLRTQLTAPTISDPAEWHNSPICHVYIAACCSVEHYRDKVRPSLRAFINQIDGAGSGNAEKAMYAAREAARKEFGAKKQIANKREQVAAANRAVAAAKDAAGGNTSSQYLIIFIPIHPSSVENEISSHPMEDAYKGGGLGLRGRLAAATAAARRNHHTPNRPGPSETSATDDDDSISYAGKDDGATSPSSSSSSSQIFMLSKDHKEIHRKFMADFPKGRTCVLSTLLDSENNLAPESPIQKQEFHSVLQEMGKTVLSGFVDRVKRYNEELKRCENEKSIPGSPSRKSMPGSPSRKFACDWEQYFLIKESVAFTFEQMKLPLEAIREYEELESTIPVGSLNEGERGNFSNSNLAIATTGRTESFRKLVKSTGDMGSMYHLTSMYLFARQAHLLFLQKLPGAVIGKCLAYVKRMHKLRCAQAISMITEDRKMALLQSEIWAASACWDTKSAAESLYSQLISNGELNDKVPTPSSPKSKSQALGIPGFNEKAFISSVCDVLNFARLRLITISEMVFTPDTLIRKAMAECPSDALEAWVPWNDCSRTKEVPTLSQGNPLLVSTDVVDQTCSTGWLLEGFKSERRYEDIYIELCDTIVALNTFMKRNRCASRILAELAEIYILRGDLEAAVDNLMTTIDNCSLDPWDKLLAWRVFRLACCQRRQRNEPEYLKSLTYCLGSRLAKAVPAKLRHLLQQDLEALVCSEEVSDFRWTLSPLLGIELNIQETPGGKSPLSLLKTDVLMHTCEIGDKVQAEVLVESTLSNPVQVDCIKVFLLRVDDYQRLAEANDEVSESDAAFVLRVNDSSIEPGSNTFKFPWPAMSVGQYVLACVCIQWQKATFYHDFTTLSRGVVGFDVLPNEPTQSIELNPIFLIPGHIQNVRLLFHSGADVVNGGRVQLQCSQGLQVMLPEDNRSEGCDEWQDSCEFDLGSCLPNSTTTFIASVKSEAIDTYDPNASEQNGDDYSYSALQTLEATVTTSYHHGLYAPLVKENKNIESLPITAILEASVTTLELAALTIKNAGAFPIGDDKFVISATVLCNTPVPFSLKEWGISLPPTLTLDTDGDMNDGLYNRSVIEGEELFFGFRCKRSKNPTETVEEAQTILSIVLQDQFGKSFRQVLPLDIHPIDKHLGIGDDVGNDAAAIAELKASSLEGLIGAPVTFTYNIDYSALQTAAASSQILYHLSCIEAGWIVGGSVRGTFSCCSESESSSSLSFVGIPTKAGTIRNFPRIELALLQDNLNDSTAAPSSIKVHHKHPSTFASFTHTNIDAMACASLANDI